MNLDRTQRIFIKNASNVENELLLLSWTLIYHTTFCTQIMHKYYFSMANSKLFEVRDIKIDLTAMTKFEKFYTSSPWYDTEGNWQKWRQVLGWKVKASIRLIVSTQHLKLPQEYKLLTYFLVKLV